MPHYVVKDFKANLKAEELEKEVNEYCSSECVKIISFEYVKHEYKDLNKMPEFKTFIRLVGEKNMGKSSKQLTVLKG
mgnify:CR=1 FL=1